MEKLFRYFSVLITITGGLFGLVLSLLVVLKLFGAGGVLVGILLFPYTFFYTPIYTLLADGSWNLLIFNYGWLAVSWWLPSITAGREAPPRLAIDEPATQPVVTKEYASFNVLILIVGVLILAVIGYALVRS